MAEPDAYSILFKRALAQHLHDRGLALYKPAGAYSNAETATLPGVQINGPDLPTLFDHCIIIATLQPIPDGRANMLYRFQLVSRVKGNSIAAENLAGKLRLAFDHKENIPAGFHVSWVELFAELAFSADASGRCATSQTLHFRGRRPLAQ